MNDTPDEPLSETTGAHRLPGDPTPRQMIERMIRVDHAGEYGAKRIYQGQLAVLGRSDKAGLLRHMQAQEQVHLDSFAEMIATRRVRPTALLPLWHIAGFALGALTARLGERAAMACTVAVEETIDAHYSSQIAELDESEAELRQRLTQFRDEEIEHRDIALAHGAATTPGYPVLSTAVKAGSRLAIWLSTRI